MRIKAKSAVTLSQLPLRTGLPPGLEDLGGADPAVPYRLVPAPSSAASLGAPPVLTASNTRDGAAPKKAGAGVMQAQPRLPPPGPRAAAQRQGSVAAAGDSGGEDVAAGTATGRPQRKRKQPAHAEDMVPSDVLTRRSKPRLPPPQLPPPPPSRPFHMLPVTAALAAAHAAQAGADGARQMPAAIQLVTVPAPGGGTMTGLAIPPAALLAMPGLLQQHLRAGGAALQLQPSMMPMLGRPPYRLVPAVQPSERQELPAVQVAAPKDVVHLARQAEEEERRRALAEADARVLVRVGQASQAAGQAQGKASKPGRLAQASGGQGRSSLVGGAGAAGGGGRGGARARRAVAERAADLPPGTWHPGFQSLDGVTHVGVAQAAAAPHLPAVVVGTPPRTSHPPAQDLQDEVGRVLAACLATCMTFSHASCRCCQRRPGQACQGCVSAHPCAAVRVLGGPVALQPGVPAQSSAHSGPPACQQPRRAAGRAGQAAPAPRAAGQGSLCQVWRGCRGVHAAAPTHVCRVGERAPACRPPLCAAQQGWPPLRQGAATGYPQERAHAPSTASAGGPLPRGPARQQRRPTWRPEEAGSAQARGRHRRAAGAQVPGSAARGAAPPAAANSRGGALAWTAGLWRRRGGPAVC
jgi:hypothetical protein